jgi:hypothetical protein
MHSGHAGGRFVTDDGSRSSWHVANIGTCVPQPCALRLLIYVEWSRNGKDSAFYSICFELRLE